MNKLLPPCLGCLARLNCSCEYIESNTMSECEDIINFKSDRYDKFLEELKDVCENCDGSSFYNAVQEIVFDEIEGNYND